MDLNKSEQINETSAENSAPKIKMPDYLTVSPSPHIKNRDNTTVVMMEVIIALLPALIWGIYKFGLRALFIAILSIGFSVGLEATTQYLLRRPITINDCSAAVTGMLLAMNLPVSIPLWMTFVGAFFAIVVVKQLFGGIGKNFVNPALASRVFLFSWASEMSTFTSAGETIHSIKPVLNSVDIVAEATPLAALKEGVIPEITISQLIRGECGGCIGEMSSVLLIAGGIFLLIRKVITWHIPVAYLGTVAIITLLLPKGGALSPEFMLYELFSGGLILGAIFMATDYSTSPVTPVGRIIFGVGCGLITVLIRYFGSYPEGVSFSILIMNLLVWYIDGATMPRRFGGKSDGK